VVFTETAAGLGIRRKRTRRYRPQTNGKVERFNKTLLDEWAYARLYRSNAERRRAFTRWLRLYNHRRPHTSLDGQTPMAVLVNNAGGKHRCSRTTGQVSVLVMPSTTCTRATTSLPSSSRLRASARAITS
jgi:hypothetical protein